MSRFGDLVFEGETLSLEAGVSADAVLSARKADSLSFYPLALRIDGTVYSTAHCPEKPCKATLLYFNDDSCRRAYERSLKLVLFTAIHSIYGDIEAIERFSLSDGVYISIKKADGTYITRGELHELKAKCDELIAARLSIVRHELSVADAAELFENNSRGDKAAMLAYSKEETTVVYSLSGHDYFDSFFGDMLEDTGALVCYSLDYLSGAIVLVIPSIFPLHGDGGRDYPKKLAAILSESERWGELMHCSTVAELNRITESGEIDELIRVNEALHERLYAKTADLIAQRAARAVMIAGPSSSGKTTSAHRIMTQLRTLGQEPVVLSLDNYYFDRDKLPRGKNGELDLEHINTLDTQRFSSDMARLMDGETVETPVFDFTTHKRSEEPLILKAGKDRPLIVEGIHGLNPLMLSGDVAGDRVFRVYVSALTTLNLDLHDRVRTTDVRLLRRLVRDYFQRDAKVDATLSMWSSVRRGEERWIFPYQELSDVMINTSLVYELAVLKKYAVRLLEKLSAESRHYNAACEILRFLSYFESASDAQESQIPPCSILREFIGTGK